MNKNNKLPVGYSVEGVVARAGGAAAVASALGITYQSVYGWQTIPRKHAEKVAVMAGLPLAVVRPDLVR